MKYAILVGDGMADMPIAELGNKTPLEYAATPNMDTLAAQGCVGRIQTIPQGFEPGSDVANMSLLGYDPAIYFSGRAPIEAASMGIALGSDDTALRCNLVTIDNGIMKDYSAGHIETEDAHRIILELQKLETGCIHFYPGVSYRHLCVITGFPAGKTACTPPHDISGKKVAPYVPSGAGAAMLKELAEKAHALLQKSPTNQQRMSAGKLPVTDIWLWGQGQSKKFPSLNERYGMSGSVISAVDLVRGLGVLAGLNVVRVTGATGYLGTNYAGKVAAALDTLGRNSFVFVHVEAPDETSHEGIVQKKLQAIEEFDCHVVGAMLKASAAMPDLRIAVLPDHATCIATKTHHNMPIPFVVAGAGITPDGGKSYSEKAAAHGKQYTGVSFFEEFIKGSFN